MEYRVKIKPGMHHSSNYTGGDVIVVTEAEYKAFGDKFILLEKAEQITEDVDTEEAVEHEQEPEPEGEVELDITDAALDLALEHDLMDEIWAMNGSGSGQGGTILVKDVEAMAE